jgi:hypothetical protein
VLSFTDTTRIHATPEAVWDFFAAMDEHYREWHPEHVVWRNVKGNATVPGSVIYADEHVGWFRLRGRFLIGNVERNRAFSFGMGFPFSLVNAGGSFHITPTDDGCDLEAETHFGFSGRWTGPILDFVLTRVMPTEDLRRHMAEEGRNLDRLLSG